MRKLNTELTPVLYIYDSIYFHEIQFEMLNVIYMKK